MTIKNRMRLLANQLLKRTGFVLHRAEIENQLARFQVAEERQSLRGLIKHIKQLGFQPNTVIDVGAAYGTSELYETFPNAYHLLIEPLTEYRAALEKLRQHYAQLDIVYAAASHHNEGIILHVHPDLVGSSAFLEAEDSNVNGEPRIVPTVRLDAICQERQLAPPYLLKVDVQGAELDVLRGASKILDKIDYIVLEVLLFEFYKGAPQFYDILQYMMTIGFVAYDFTAPHYRLLDNAVSQIDIAFVREDSLFRQQHYYATVEQREVQNTAMLKYAARHKAL